ncbi:hypothetical protein INT47_009463 [Mucor saturninus]|uniref:C2H2-type domain-containing protein n=1 Tax=Mucor saturninus TaxID=64648 RepID=A0A8H7QR47_9FUNG|nr:hypothetical protein INT47_009463 [Mucor saturninus]
MVMKNHIRRTAYVDNVCCECGSPYSSPSYLIKHMMEVHQIQLHPRMQSRSRPISTQYEFVKSKSDPHQCLFYGCPSCWFYCPQDLQRLAKHIQDTHLVDLEDGYETPEYEEEKNVVYEH